MSNSENSANVFIWTGSSAPSWALCRHRKNETLRRQVPATARGQGPSISEVGVQEKRRGAGGSSELGISFGLPWRKSTEVAKQFFFFANFQDLNINSNGVCHVFSFTIITMYH